MVLSSSEYNIGFLLKSGAPLTQGQFSCPPGSGLELKSLNELLDLVAVKLPRLTCATLLLAWHPDSCPPLLALLFRALVTGPAFFFP